MHVEGKVGKQQLVALFTFLKYAHSEYAGILPHSFGIIGLALTSVLFLQVFNRSISAFAAVPQTPKQHVRRNEIHVKFMGGEWN